MMLLLVQRIFEKKSAVTRDGGTFRLAAVPPGGRGSNPTLEGLPDGVPPAFTAKLTHRLTRQVRVRNDRSTPELPPDGGQDSNPRPMEFRLHPPGNAYNRADDGHDKGDGTFPLYPTELPPIEGWAGLEPATWSFKGCSSIGIRERRRRNMEAASTTSVN
ncbi:hypothetical protein [Xanthomonas rydalmerensis]|uniref:Uncharacterized protein n=1 Tax=Xanthomonas rydalmerensis TaxID=3046274 RepID=A0ABZ0JHV5_9XANT|nr:hypothetical protein [Xanthomonas sp. DM-2023]WOS39387.1 hypothetical protein QN243_13220 [Xanthomonas sp. DM-2023]WOS43571.1 hypothetical protein QN242_13220 [Xanthomonas sp. DM-2023]WOS47752.1 hypothetical protein QN240_13220 [Xanthomonas sp. DM-2023]WOS51930.1 hypothetical protein QN244_13220 [Xanthomonas sp. DM-2023]WOS56114.1 hypothetical protein QN245_13220 [Xanthomonas sp. DM-2023]